MPLWSDLFKLFTYAGEQDPLSKQTDTRQFQGGGVAQPEALGVDFTGGGPNAGMANFRQTKDMIDTTTLTNRAMRYKEYERLRNVPEIEMAMTVFSDEACVIGDTKVVTPFGPIAIKDLAETKKDERFLVYCYDFENKDYTLGWACAPRYVKDAETVTIVLDNGSTLTCTTDHKVLKRDESWIEAGKLKEGDELMPFYRKQASYRLTKMRQKQFPRIFTFNKGWIHEKQLVDEWKSGKTEKKLEAVNLAMKMIGSGIPVRQIEASMKHEWITIEKWMHEQGFSHKETKLLYKSEDRRRIIGIHKNENKQPVYDLSVEKHQCFATDSLIVHNCQKDETGNVLKVLTQNEEVKQEIEFLLLHRRMLNMNRNGWGLFKSLCIFGDLFLEIIINLDNPKEGIYKTVPLPPETMYRIETVKGKTLEFQQSKEGPDYQAIVRCPVEEVDDNELNNTTAIRFATNQIVHFKIGDDRKTFYPYGQSLIEPARGPAHNLRLLEDAMVIYRLCLVGDTRIRTLNGYKHIRDLNKGDIVYSYNQKGDTLKANIINFMNNGVKDVYKVSSKHVQITGTATHPLLVSREGIIQYVDIQDLIVGKDKIINVTRDEEKQVEIPSIIGGKWAKLDRSQRTAFRNAVYENKSSLMRRCGNINRIRQFLYTEGKALPLDQAIKICEVFDLDPSKLIIANKGQINSERITLPKYVDEDFARLFGFLIGDGSVRKNGFQLSFAAGIDEKQNNFYKNLLKKYFGKVRFEKEKRNKNKNLGNYVVDSSTACKILLTMGFIPGARNKRIPDWVHTAPKNIRRAFVEGISNADGCERYTKAGTWFSTIELCNQKLVEDIKEVWASIGLCSGKLVHRKKKGGHEIEKGRKMPPTECWSVTISNRELPKYENVTSVEHVGQEEVFDITVDNEIHNFIANCTPVHNTRAPERRVFYIDVGQLPPFKAEAFLDRVKDQFRKRKIASNKGSAPGANAVEERWQPPAQDEDYWLPTRPNSNTRIETLPGAENLGEIDDAIYFRNKLFISLNFPKNYFNNEDVNTTRISLSAQDIKFARMIERLQSNFEDGLLEIAERHLNLRGYPEKSYQDLKIKMTPPSDWRELSRTEVVSARYGNAGSIKSANLMSDYDIISKILKYGEDETEEMLARLKLQKLEDLKLQVLAQNPQLLGVGIPGQEKSEPELGTAAGGPTTMPGPDGEQPPGGEQPEGAPGSEGEQPPQEGQAPGQQAPEPMNLEEPTEEDLKKYDLEIQGYEAEQDIEDIDYSVGEG
jgi:intein/homing endonuclease